MQTSESVCIITIPKVKEPKKCKVIIFNNNVTDVGTVFIILTEIFNKNADKAKKIVSEADTSGKALVGIYTKEIAKTLIELAGNIDRNLKFEIEEDA